MKEDSQLDKNSNASSIILNRLKRLVAGSDVGQSGPPEEVAPAAPDETNPDIRGNESGMVQSGPPEEVAPAAPDETNPDIRGNESGMVQSGPPEEVAPAAPDKTNPDIQGRESGMVQRSPPEEIAPAALDRHEYTYQPINQIRGGGTMDGEYVVNYKNVIVKTSDGSVISGKTNIDIFGRVSDYFRQGTEKFIIVFNEDAETATKKVTIINKDHIIWVNTWD